MADLQHAATLSQLGIPTRSSYGTSQPTAVPSQHAATFSQLLVPEPADPIRNRVGLVGYSPVPDSHLYVDNEIKTFAEF